MPAGSISFSAQRENRATEYLRGQTILSMKLCAAMLAPEYPYLVFLETGSARESKSGSPHPTDWKCRVAPDLPENILSQLG